ncbi:hypothetical protein GT51_02448 [Listeria monocytogenes]|nr:hypothetical protein GT51_02448 [Listeria monocytogenes]
MNIQAGSKVKTTYKTKFIKKGERGTVKEIAYKWEDEE